MFYGPVQSTQCELNSIMLYNAQSSTVEQHILHFNTGPYTKMQYRTILCSVLVSVTVPRSAVTPNLIVSVARLCQPKAVAVCQYRNTEQNHCTVFQTALPGTVHIYSNTVILNYTPELHSTVHYNMHFSFRGPFTIVCLQKAYCI